MTEAPEAAIAPHISRTRALLGRAIDILIPPRCIACNEQVDVQGKLCLECWNKLRFISSPQCARCGLPFEIDLGDGAICASCAQEEPAFTKARSAFRYDDASRRLVTTFKFSDRTYKASAFAEMLWRAGTECWSKADIIAPVPLHRRRLFARRYNQSALLAKEVALRANKPSLLDLLVRTRHTTPQTGLSRKERQENVHNVFRVKERYAQNITGKHIVLIDDVLTTGATVEACSKALRKAKAAEIYIVTLARATRHEA